MIKLEVHHQKMELEVRGSDELIIDELSLAIIRLLYALEKSQGNPLEDNLTILIMSLLARRDNPIIPPC